ncbi:Biotin/lipoate A/B protein ligase family, putative [Hepatocystis sp. ex Piliocolobus tephrosceles]|nr:Biotin/lipoate A/B protein ligase family, putative [Hepatocystis sp. ex Piliocolobus tephrosceles]
MGKEKVIYEVCYPTYCTYRYHFHGLDSTQLFCKRNKKEFIESKKLKDETSIIAVSCNYQTNGIGTRDTKSGVNKIWVSEIGNLFISFVFLWKKSLYQKVGCLSQAATVAISKTLEKYNLKCQIKWINDVYINNKKISGCIVNVCDVNYDNDDDHDTTLYTRNTLKFINNDYVYIITGIGINIALDNDQTILNNDFTSMKREIQKKQDNDNDVSDDNNSESSNNNNNNRVTPSVERVTETLIEQFYIVICTLIKEGFTSFLDYITIRLLYKDKQVLIDQDNNKIIGYIKGISDDGSIILVNDHNQTIHVNTGRLFLYQENCDL